MAHPKPNGRAMPARPTLRAILQLDTSRRRSTSRPTRKRNSISPMLAASERVGIEAAGKMASVKPGARPRTEGPSRMPPMTSAMTRGWRILERGKWRRRQKMIMMPACKGVGSALLQGWRWEKREERSRRGKRNEVIYLDDEHDDGVLGVIFGGIGTLEDATLARCSRHRGRRSDLRVAG